MNLIVGTKRGGESTAQLLEKFLAYQGKKVFVTYNSDEARRLINTCGLTPNEVVVNGVNPRAIGSARRFVDEISPATSWWETPAVEWATYTIDNEFVDEVFAAQ